MIEFAYFVLALSWSPEYCATGGATRDKLQCIERRYGFVTHGLWPQHDRGYPRNCPSSSRVSDAVVKKMLDIMPNPGLVRHQWDVHGTCSGLAAEGYFDLVRRAYSGVKIPPEFQRPGRYVTIAPAELERKFLEANRGMAGDGVAVICNGRNVREVRICLSKNLKPRACGVDVRDQCRVEKAVLRPVR